MPDETARLEERQANNIIAADVVGDELVLKRHDRTVLRVPAGGGGGDVGYDASAEHMGYMVAFGFFLPGAQTQTIFLHEGGGAYSEETATTLVSWPKVVAPGGVVQPGGNSMWTPPWTARAWRESNLVFEVSNLDGSQQMRISYYAFHQKDELVPAKSVQLNTADGASGGAVVGTDLVWDGATGVLTSIAGGTFIRSLTAKFNPV